MYRKDGRMGGYVVVGGQWGDEGKGKIVDVLAKKAAYVVRFQGGNNAGHTVVVNNQKHILHLLPSGVLHAQATCIIGAGVVVDPFVLLEEMAMLEKMHICIDHIQISDRAHLIMPYHVKMDRLEEERKKEKKVGTTQRGIGPCYSDKYLRIGLRMCDLIDFESFKKKLKYILQIKNEQIEKIYHEKGFVYEEMVEKFAYVQEQLKNRLVDSFLVLQKAYEKDQFVLFEGAQAAMLDINYGNYPYVTSSSPTSGVVCSGAPVPPHHIKRIIAVVKAYSTRVGEGPFVCEQNNEMGAYLRKVGNEYGATTGRERRCGWLDLVIVKHAIAYNGAHTLVLTKLDVLSSLKKIPICVAYEIEGEIVDFLIADTQKMAKAKPIYESMEGWQEDISHIQNYEDLPINCKKYIEKIEQVCKVSVSMISLGPQRENNLYIHDIFI